MISVLASLYRNTESAPWLTRIFSGVIPIPEHVEKKLKYTPK